MKTDTYMKTVTFIIGPQGSGKSTQVRKMVEGKKSLTFDSFPDDWVRSFVSLEDQDLEYLVFEELGDVKGVETNVIYQLVESLSKDSCIKARPIYSKVSHSRTLPDNIIFVMRSDPGYLGGLATLFPNVRIVVIDVVSGIVKNISPFFGEPVKIENPEEAHKQMNAKAMIKSIDIESVSIDLAAALGGLNFEEQLTVLHNVITALKSKAEANSQYMSDDIARHKSFINALNNIGSPAKG